MHRWLGNQQYANQSHARQVVDSEEIGRMDIRLLAIAFDNRNIFRFLFAAPVQLASRLDAEYRRTAWSFRRLNRSEVAQIRPYRLVVHTVGYGDTVQKLAQRMPFEKFNRERFLVLNALTDRSVLERGQRVKLVTH